MQSDHTSRGDSLRSHSKSLPPTASGGAGPLQPACLDILGSHLLADPVVLCDKSTPDIPAFLEQSQVARVDPSKEISPFTKDP